MLHQETKSIFYHSPNTIKNVPNFSQLDLTTIIICCDEVRLTSSRTEENVLLGIEHMQKESFPNVYQIREILQARLFQKIIHLFSNSCGTSSVNICWFGHTLLATCSIFQ